MPVTFSHAGMYVVTKVKAINPEPSNREIMLTAKGEGTFAVLFSSPFLFLKPKTANTQKDNGNTCNYELLSRGHKSLFRSVQ